MQAGIQLGFFFVFLLEMYNRWSAPKAVLMEALIPNRPLKQKQSISVSLATKQKSKKPTNLLRISFL